MNIDMADEKKQKDNVPENYKKLLDLFKQAEVLLGGKDLDEISELTDDQFEKLSEIKTSILKQCVIMVKQCGNSDFLGEIQQEWLGEHFWKKLNERLESMTSLFLRASDIRKMSQEEKEELLIKVFNYYYIERETPEYISKKMRLDKCFICASYSIIGLCEYLYVFKHCSKRRFIANMVESSGLMKPELELLWNAFCENSERVEQFAMADKINQINRTLEGLSKQIKSMDETIDLNTDILFDLYDIVGEGEDNLFKSKE